MTLIMASRGTWDMLLCGDGRWLPPGADLWWTLGGEQLQRAQTFLGRHPCQELFLPRKRLRRRGALNSKVPCSESEVGRGVQPKDILCWDVVRLVELGIENRPVN